MVAAQAATPSGRLRLSETSYSCYTVHSHLKSEIFPSMRDFLEATLFMAVLLGALLVAAGAWLAVSAILTLLTGVQAVAVRLSPSR